MNLLSPTAMALAAALTIPPLIALYFLKLKREARAVPSTLLWKRTVEDLQVNAPFQRLRSSLLLILQLLVLALAALALGKPMFATAPVHQDTVIILIDQSASMAVVEEDGRTRLEHAKEQAHRVVDNLGPGARAMVIAFCDRANVESSFDTDRQALRQRIDDIEQTQSTSRLGEAITLSEAYAQMLIIGGEELGTDIAPESAAAPATVFLITDGRLEDADRVSFERIDPGNIRLVQVGSRADNVGILNMDARRHYESPTLLEATATVQNFGPDPVTVDAVLTIEGQTVDVITLELAGSRVEGVEGSRRRSDVAPGSIGVAAFKGVEFGGSGVVEVALRIDDALAADNRAWTILEAPHDTKVLLVTERHPYYRPLESVLSGMMIDLTIMTPREYEQAREDQISDGRRSLFDVVVFDRHTTERLPQGNYMFWGSFPIIDGVTAQGVVGDEIIFHWDETHPVLRHVSMEAVSVHQWLRLRLPPEATTLVSGATSPVISHLVRDTNQYLVVAFGLLVRDDEDGSDRRNTLWPAGADFIVFMQNAVSYLASNLATTGSRGVTPGEPVIALMPDGAGGVDVIRPDGGSDRFAATASQTIHYARTRQVGVYRVEPGVPGRNLFAVNLFNATESRVAPPADMALGAEAVSAKASLVETSAPAWRYVLLVLLLILLFEWFIYNRRVFV